MAIEKELLDQFLAGRDSQESFAKDGLFDELKKALSERILNAELDDHLSSDTEENKKNHRNGASKKTKLTGTSKVTLDGLIITTCIEPIREKCVAEEHLSRQ